MDTHNMLKKVGFKFKSETRSYQTWVSQKHNLTLMFDLCNFTVRVGLQRNFHSTLAKLSVDMLTLIAQHIETLKQRSSECLENEQ